MNPSGYDLASVLLDAANAVALAALVATLLELCPLGEIRGRQAWLAGATAAAFFGVHQLRVEAVAWASCQPYLPCALGMILAYLKAASGPVAKRRGWLVVAWLLGVAAMLCKAVAVTLPAVLAILDVSPLRRLGAFSGGWFGKPARRVWVEVAPFALASLPVAPAAVAARDSVRALESLGRLGIGARLVQAAYRVWFFPGRRSPRST